MKSLALILLLTSFVNHQSPVQRPKEVSNLEYFIGDWAATGYSKSSEGAMEWSATAKGTWALNQCFLNLDLKIVMGKDPAREAKALISYDPVAKAYRGSFFLSSKPIPMVTQGKIEGSKLVLVGGPPGADDVQGKFIFEMAEGSFAMTVVTEDPAGGGTLTGTFKRK
jgi:hypothetical protein